MMGGAGGAGRGPGLLSADSHVQIPDAAWAAYLDPDLRSRAPRLEVVDGEVFRVFEGGRRRLGAHDTLGAQAGKQPETYAVTTAWVDQQQGGDGASDPAQRLRDQDADGVFAEVLYFGGPLVEASDDDLRLRSYRAYNRWLADFCSHCPERLVGAAAIPPDSPETALVELRAAVDLGFRTGYLPLFPTTGSFADPAWEGFWVAAEAVGWPIGLHIGSLRREARRFDDAGIFMTQNLMARMSMAEALGELVLCGVLARHPGLRVVSVEAQVGWMSFAVEHMDRVWDKHRHWSGSPLEERPSAYFHRQVFATFTDDPAGLREARAIGIGNIMWSSDFPHAETSWPDSQAVIDGWAVDLDETERARVLWGNAADLYGIDVPTPAGSAGPS